MCLSYCPFKNYFTKNHDFDSDRVMRGINFFYFIIPIFNFYQNDFRNIEIYKVYFGNLLTYLNV